MSTRSEALWTFSQALAERITAMRTTRGWTRAHVSRLAADYGLRWGNGALRDLELGKRVIAVYEVVVLARIFETTMAEMLVDLPIGDPIRLNAEDEGLKRAAERVNLPVEKLELAAQRLWGRSLYAEREARINLGEDMRTNQAHRGHVTRAMLEEVRVHLASQYT